MRATTRKSIHCPVYRQPAMTAIAMMRTEAMASMTYKLPECVERATRPEARSSGPVTNARYPQTGLRQVP